MLTPDPICALEVKAEAGRLTEELLSILKATPEFWQVGFTAEHHHTSRDVLIYRKNVYRGRWRDGGTGLIWSSPEMICRTRYAPDAADAARQTMLAILQFLQVRSKHGRGII